jgi:cytochrome c-type biogenesis protein CcmE
MKQLQKFILPALVILVIFLVYSVYFSKGEDLGSFSDFDTNNSAVKDIRVEILQERGIINNEFYVRDKTGRVIVVHSDNIPAGIESERTVVLRGHLNPDSFHAHDVLID